MSPKRASTESKKHHGGLKSPLSVPALEIKQGSQTLYVFVAKASVLYDALSINRRVKDKEEGYQRVLSISRIEAVGRYLSRNRAIPGAIIVNLDRAEFNPHRHELTIPSGSDVGWVIDGQHRLIGAAKMTDADIAADISFPVVAFVGLERKRQIEQFITINREAKNVPTSLYLDLLKYLPQKRASDVIKERATDLATQLRRDEDGPFFQRIAHLAPPKKGQVSLVNFVRKISIHIAKNGVLNSFTEFEQLGIISNYYSGLRNVFPDEFDSEDSAFFKTLGFGALWNAFPTVFSLSLRHREGFTVQDVSAIFRKIRTTDFSEWSQHGSGDQAERQVGEDLRASLQIAFTADPGPLTSIKL